MLKLQKLNGKKIGKTKIMAENSKIEWTTHTFNPWQGCTKVSPGCKHCYAETTNDRFGWTTWGKGNPRKRTSKQYWLKPLLWNKRADKWHARPCVFCASLADWLDDEVPIEWLADLLNLIRLTPNLDWLLLSKLPELWKDRIFDCFDLGSTDQDQWLVNWLNGSPPHNVWIGTSVENQVYVDKRIPELLQIPAAIRFLSVEPLLGPVDLLLYDSEIDWIIVGGESGPNARPMDSAWVDSIYKQCHRNDVPFFFKQWGGVKKAASGRLLHGRTWDELP